MVKNGPIAPFDFEKAQASLPYTGQGNEWERGEVPKVLPLFWNNHWPTSCFESFVDYPEHFRNEGTAMLALAFTCHVELRIATWVRRSLNYGFDGEIMWMLRSSMLTSLLDQGKNHLSKPLRLFKPNHVIILVRPCNGCFSKCRFFNRGRHGYKEKLGSLQRLQRWKEMDGPILPSIKRIDSCRKRNTSFQKAATCQHWRNSQESTHQAPLRRSKSSWSIIVSMEVKSVAIPIPSRARALINYEGRAFLVILKPYQTGNF